MQIDWSSVTWWLTAGVGLLAVLAALLYGTLNWLLNHPD